MELASGPPAAAPFGRTVPLRLGLGSSHEHARSQTSPIRLEQVLSNSQNCSLDVCCNREDSMICPALKLCDCGGARCQGVPDLLAD